MNQKKKILMIPSWYPTKEHPYVGGFFQQQAALFQERYDIKVMYGYCPYLEHKSLYGRYHRYMTRRQENEKTVEIQDPIPTIRFTYGNWWMGERSLLYSAIIRYRRELKKLINKGWKPDILHAQCTELAGIISAKLSEEFEIPWILTEHQVFALANYSFYRQKLIKNSLETPKEIAVVSQHQLRCMAIHNIHRPMTVVGNLIDEDIFTLNKSEKDPGKFRILTVTWPSKIKDSDTFLHALAVLVERGHSDIKVTVIGQKVFDEGNTNDLEQLAEKYKVKDYCKFIASVPHQEMLRYYGDSDVFVSTSIAETFGVAVREAMAVGTPVVCTASGGVDEDIHDFNGIKVDIYDYRGIADALIYIKTNQGEFISKNISKYVIDKYGKQAFLEKMSGIFNKTLYND